MPMTGASGLLTQLQTQIAACASWSAGSSGVHYPSIEFASATFPCCVIAEMNRTSEYYASGASGLRGGTLKITIYSTGTVGATEVLGQAIVEELLAQQTGIAFRSGSVVLAGEATDAMDAAQTTVSGVELDLEYGLSA